MSARIFFAGAAVGAVVGALAMFALRSNQAELQVSDDANRSLGAAAAPTDPSSVPAGEATWPAAPSAAKATTDADGMTAPAPVTNEPVAAVPPDTDDAKLRSYFDEWGKSPNMGQLNARLKAEARDESWASDMETQLQDYLARRPAPNAIGTVSIECRMTICRLISVVDSAVFEAVPYTDLQAALNDLPNESLGRELVFSNSAVSVDVTEPSQTMEVAILRRADEKGDARR